MSYSTKLIVVTINSVPIEFIGKEDPEMELVGDYFVTDSGTNGDFHNREKYDVLPVLHLNLKWNSPNIAYLDDLAKNHVEFAASYKDGNTGEVYNTTKGVVKNIGSKKADADRKFDINFVP